MSVHLFLWECIWMWYGIDIWSEFICNFRFFSHRQVEKFFYVLGRWLHFFWIWKRSQLRYFLIGEYKFICLLAGPASRCCGWSFCFIRGTSVMIIILLFYIDICKKIWWLQWLVFHYLSLSIQLLFTNRDLKS